MNTGIDRALRLAERFVERGVRRVGAVGDHDEAGERQAGQLVARALERRAEPRGRAAVFQVRDRRLPVDRRGEAEEPQDEPIGQGLRTGWRSVPDSCSWTNALRGWPSVSAMVMLRESSTRTATKFCCGTDAFRMSVGRNRQIDQQGEHADPQADQHDPVAKRLLAAGVLIGQQRAPAATPAATRMASRDRAGNTPRQVALLKDEQRILEQEAKNGFEHGWPILMDTDVPKRNHEMLSQLISGGLKLRLYRKVALQGGSDAAL